MTSIVAVIDLHIYGDISEEKLRAKTDTDDWRHNGRKLTTFYGQAEVIRTNCISKSIPDLRKTSYYFVAEKFGAVHYYERGHGPGKFVRKVQNKMKRSTATATKHISTSSSSSPISTSPTDASSPIIHEEAAITSKGPKLVDHFIATPQYSANARISVAEAKNNQGAGQTENNFAIRCGSH